MRTHFALLHEVTMVEILMHLCVGAIEIGTLLKNQVAIAVVSTRMCFLKPFLEIYRECQRCQTEIHYLIYNFTLIYDCSPIVLKIVFAGIARNPRYWPDVAYYRVITKKIQLEKREDHAFTSLWSHDHNR